MIGHFKAGETRTYSWLVLDILYGGVSAMFALEKTLPSLDF